MRTRLLLLAAALAALTPLGVAQARGAPVSGHPAPATANEPAGTGDRSGVIGGALFGGTGTLVDEEPRLHRRLAIIRVYYHVGDTFPTKVNSRLMESGSTLLVSLDTPPGKGPSYASIAAGHYDHTIGAFLRAMNHAAIEYHLGAIYICFEHEADDPSHLALGSPAQFIRAWDHVHQLAWSEHLDWNHGGRLHWVLILENAAYLRVLPHWLRGRGASSYWPGRSKVGIVAADGYNHRGCKHTRQPGSAKVTPETLFGPVISFARAHGGLPVFISEWGSQVGSQQPVFIRKMQHFVTANREIAGAMYFDERSPQHRSCNSIVNGHPASLSALATMGHAPHLQGHLRGHRARSAWHLAATGAAGPRRGRAALSRRPEAPHPLPRGHRLTQDGPAGHGIPG